MSRPSRKLSADELAEVERVLLVEELGGLPGYEIPDDDPNEKGRDWPEPVHPLIQLEAQRLLREHPAD